MVPGMSDDLIQLAHVRALTSSGAARALRLSAQLSLGEVARAIGVGTPTVLRWENGERSPQLSPAVLAYADLLDRLANRAAPRRRAVKEVGPSESREPAGASRRD
jgi:transcriptional regulator with XRE-family HTH domain